MYRLRTLSILALVLLTGCDWFISEQADEPIIARYKNTVLYVEDVTSQIPSNLSSDDSLALAKNLIDNWTEKQVLVNHAANNINIDDLDIEQQVAEYKNDLLIYAFENKLVSQKLDTAISPDEIRDYYDNNKSNFELKDFIVKVLYVKLDSNAPQLDKVRMWLKSSDESDFEQLEDYCHQFANNYFLDDQSWVYLNDLLREVPLQMDDTERFLRQRKFVDFTGNGTIYLVRLQDYKLKNSLSPLSLEREKIKNLILNQRKRALIARMKKDIYKRAQEKGDFEVYSIE